MIAVVVIVILGAFAVSSATASARGVMGCSRVAGGYELLTSLKAHPRDCGNPALGGTTAGIQGAHWRHWGAPVATGSGHLVDGLGFRYPARFWVFGRSRRDGIRFYSRMHLISTGEVRGGSYRPGLNRTVRVTPHGLATGHDNLVAMSAATAATKYRICFRGHIQVIKARPSVECARADRIARAGLHVDGDDGAHFRLFGRRWQCVTIKRPDHGRHTLLGCFTPSAPRHLGARTHPRVTLLLKKQAN